MSCLIIFYNHNTRVLQKCMLWVQFYNAEADSQLGLLSSCFPWLNKISHGSATWTCSSPNYTTARARGGAGQPLQLQLWSQDWSYLQQHELYHKLFFFFFTLKRKIIAYMEAWTNPKILHWHQEPETNMSRSSHQDPHQPFGCYTVNDFTLA